MFVPVETTSENAGLEDLPELAAQFLDTSLRVVTLAARVRRMPVYDTGWRMLPFALICEWQHGRAIHEWEGGVVTRTGPGDAMVIPAGTSHRTRNDGDGEAVVRWAHVRINFFEAIDLLSLLDIPPVISSPSSERLGNICERLADMTTLHAGGWMLPAITRKKMLEMELLVEILSLAPPRPTSLDLLVRIQRLAPVLQYIEDHLSDELRRATLADIAHLSPGYFDALFKQIMRITPLEYIKRLRIRSAQELLIRSNLPVAAIANKVGYNDPFHFSRQFHAVCGTDPSTYRQQFKDSFTTIR